MSRAAARRRRAALLAVAALASTLAAGSAAAPMSAVASTTAPPTTTSAPTSSATTPVSRTSTASTTSGGGGSGGSVPAAGSGSSGGSSTTLTNPTLAIDLTSLTPGVVTPESVLTIKGIIVNTGRVTVQNGTVRLLVHHSPLTTRSLVAAWGAGGIDDVGGRILGASADLSVDLAAGASVRFTIKAPAAQLGLTMADASIGITLEALGDDGTDLGTHRLGLLRTYITWQLDSATYTPLKLSWLIPITGGPSSVTGAAPSADVLAPSLGATSRLAHVVAAIASAPAGPAVSVAIDPALVADLVADSAAGGNAPRSDPTGSSSGPSGSSSSTAGAATGTATPGAAVGGYLTALKAAIAGRRVVQLPYGDPDLASSADNRGSSLLAAAAAAAGSGASSLLTKDLGVTPVTDVAYPAGGWADQATIAAAQFVGAHTLVLGAASRPPALPLFTPTGFAPLTSTTDAVFYDDELSNLLARTNSASTAVLTIQRFLAETLATAGERTGHSRILLVAAARSFNPDPAVAQRLFAAVASAPWLRPATLAQLRASEGANVVTERVTLPVPPAIRGGQLHQSQIDAVRSVRDQAADLAQVIDGDPSLTTTRTEALRLVSTSLRGHVGTAAAKTKALKAQLTAVGAKVRILPLSHLNFLASDGNLTLSVANDLTENVHNLTVQVLPQNGRLVVVRQAAPITVEAQRRTTIKVHVHAVAGGVVPVTARIVTPAGLVIGQPVTVQVHVRPTDTWAFWVLGVAAALVFLVGIRRSIRRGRSRPRLQAPEVDPL